MKQSRAAGSKTPAAKRPAEASKTPAAKRPVRAPAETKRLIVESAQEDRSDIAAELKVSPQYIGRVLQHHEDRANMMKSRDFHLQGQNLSRLRGGAHFRPLWVDLAIARQYETCSARTDRAISKSEGVLQACRHPMPSQGKSVMLSEALPQHFISEPIAAASPWLQRRQAIYLGYKNQYAKQLNDDNLNPNAIGGAKFHAFLVGVALTWTGSDALCSALEKELKSKKPLRTIMKTEARLPAPAVLWSALQSTKASWFHARFRRAYF